MQNASETGKFWSIVLSGGDGTRLKPFIRSWLGLDKPKQYCTFTGTRSLLQHTVDRASMLTPKHIVTVIDKRHLRDASEQLCNRSVSLAVQPYNRDTVSGILLPLTYIRAFRPTATVAIFPSDHFVYPEDRFIREVSSAFVAAENRTDRLILIGVEPDCAEVDYGWIKPGKTIRDRGNRLLSVESFLEKPSRQVAQEIMDSGALWNTGIIIANLECLWRLAHVCLPEVMQLFDILCKVIGSPSAPEVLDYIYSGMPAMNFSADFLQRIPEYIAVMRLEEVSWSDWGRPERIVQSLLAIQKEPAFPQIMEQVIARNLPQGEARHRRCPCTSKDSKKSPI